MKRTFFSLIFIILVAILGLWIFSRVSTAHLASVRAIFSSSYLLKEFGVVETVVLTKYSQKTGPTGKGCTTLTYFIFGAIDDDWVQVRLLSESYKSDWDVVEIKKGYNSELSVSCVYG